MATASDEQTYYVIYDDGSVGRIVTDTGTEPDLAKAGRFVSQAEYQAAVDALDAEREQQQAEEEAMRSAQAKADYEALVAAGVPEDTAARMSGYDPTEEWS
ncbi:hypothetical protein F0L17_14330 [Streptomyces sp. TRM43335]|uniref:Uncharacterized protein n=1 Tax=Streptomyces taklimakanensis TaxID=2569853 RepID=A0A6G2BDH3_9ACTN|nr:hypothetical protein [Streptomyces taklimakanensis]MTE20264.1 hypothetical protein [Streptomyces taklimakanensis]